MILEYNFPRMQGEIVIAGELEEVTGLLPEGKWAPPSDEELRVMRIHDRLALTHMQQLGVPIVESFVAPETFSRAPFIVTSETNGSVVSRLEI